MTAFFKEIEPFRGNGNENEKGQTLEEFLEEYDPYKYKNPCVTTDAVIFSCKRKVVDGEWKVLMVKRRNHPSIGWWALPGGFIELRAFFVSSSTAEALNTLTAIRTNNVAILISFFAIPKSSLEQCIFNQ